MLEIEDTAESLDVDTLSVRYVDSTPAAQAFRNIRSLRNCLRNRIFLCSALFLGGLMAFPPAAENVPNSLLWRAGSGLGLLYLAKRRFDRREEREFAVLCEVAQNEQDFHPFLEWIRSQHGESLAAGDKMQIAEITRDYADVLTQEAPQKIAA